MEEILRIARREKIRTARVEAIGRVNKLKLAFFNDGTKAYEEHDYEESLEVAVMLGNITLKDGRPFLHLHGTFGRKDMTVIGGHVVSATVLPILELVITLTKNKALRRFDDEIGLNAIYRIDG